MCWKSLAKASNADMQISNRSIEEYDFISSLVDKVVSERTQLEPSAQEILSSLPKKSKQAKSPARQLTSSMPASSTTSTLEVLGEATESFLGPIEGDPEALEISVVPDHLKIATKLLQVSSASSVLPNLIMTASHDGTQTSKGSKANRHTSAKPSGKQMPKTRSSQARSSDADNPYVQPAISRSPSSPLLPGASSRRSPKGNYQHALALSRRRHLSRTASTSKSSTERSQALLEMQQRHMPSTRQGRVEHKGEEKHKGKDTMKKGVKSVIIGSRSRSPALHRAPGVQKYLVGDEEVVAADGGRNGGSGGSGGDGGPPASLPSISKAVQRRLPSSSLASKHNNYPSDYAPPLPPPFATTIPPAQAPKLARKAKDLGLTSGSSSVIDELLERHHQSQADHRALVSVSKERFMRVLDNILQTLTESKLGLCKDATLARNLPLP